MFTFLTEKEIEEKISEQKEKPETRLCQKYLARFLTGFVHDLDSVERVEKISEVLFNGDISSLDESEFEEAFKDVKSFEVDKKQIEDIELVDLLVLSEISGSKRQAREDIENKAININGIIYCDILEKVTIDKILFDKYIVIRRGKKTYFLIKIK
jgi:tyrosyl-tRNA synthetase